MSKIVSVHSFRGGTGKSNTTANLAVAVACLGQRVGIVDTDIQSPGIHVLFRLDESKMKRSLNDYLWSGCSIQDTAYDVTPTKVTEKGGKILLMPSSLNVGEITRILREGYDVRRLHDGFREVTRALNLDYLFIDTHPGLNEETLVSITISDILVIILRPDRQDFQGTAVTVDVARKLNVPKLYLVVNRVLPNVDFNALKQQIETAYKAPVAGLLPNSDDMMQLGSSDIFFLQFPDHPLSKEFRAIANQIYEKPQQGNIMSRLFGR